MTQMTCVLLTMNNCSSVEYRRLLVMFTWIKQFPRLKFTGPSMSKFFDKLVYMARTYKPTAHLANVNSMVSVKNIFLQTYKMGYQMFTAVNLTELLARKFMALNSSKLRIDLEVTLGLNGNVVVKWVNITFYLSATLNPSKIKLNIDYSDTFSNFANGLSILLLFYFI